jgi:hypothetical protein
MKVAAFEEGSRDSARAHADVLSLFDIMDCVGVKKVLFTSTLINLSLRFIEFLVSAVLLLSSSYAKSSLLPPIHYGHDRIEIRTSS